ncbi:hypothetical protein BGZ74_003974 [Mortierella antarctica]|nr:hypothetical protein BGZ74_003974 [Mortierella antarctica]
MKPPKFRDIPDTRAVWELLERVVPDVTGMFESKNEEEEEQQQQGQEIDGETDWSDEEEGRNTDREVEMEGNEAEEEEVEEVRAWSIQDIYHGLVPQDLVKGWKQIFGASTWIAQYMVDRFVSAIEEYGRTEIWNNRCNATITWEKSIGITARSKKNRSNSGNNNFNSLNLQHRKPEKEAIHSTADNNVMKSYLGQKCLHLRRRSQVYKIKGRRLEDDFRARKATSSGGDAPVILAF